MARLVVIYKTPRDVAAFDKHYREIHIPLAKKIPGLRKMDTSKGPVVAAAGAAATHLVVTLHFDNLAAMQSALASPEGQAAGADRLNFAPRDEDVQMLLFDTVDV